MFIYYENICENKKIIDENIYNLVLFNNIKRYPMVFNLYKVKSMVIIFIQLF